MKLLVHAPPGKLKYQRGKKPAPDLSRHRKDRPCSGLSLHTDTELSAAGRENYQPRVAHGGWIASTGCIAAMTAHLSGWAAAGLEESFHYYRIKHARAGPAPLCNSHTIGVRTEHRLHCNLLYRCTVHVPSYSTVVWPRCGGCVVWPGLTDSVTAVH